MNGYDSFGHGWGMGFGMFAMLVLLILALIGVFAILKWLAGTASDGKRELSEFAETCLKERFARGEIDEATYQRQLEEIRKG